MSENRHALFARLHFGAGEISPKLRPGTQLKMAVFAPMPKASAATAATVNPGLFQKLRNANRKPFNVPSLWTSCYILSL
jgi:hypothetical protein